VLKFRLEKLVCPPTSAESSSAYNGLAFSELGDRYALFEMIHDGHLARRLGPDETLTSIMLNRWLSWGINRTEESYLLLKKDVQQFEPDKVHAFADNVKMSEFGSKAFHGVQLRIDASKVTQYSKKKYKKFQKADADIRASKKTVLKLKEEAEKPENEWSLDELLWFQGHDPERKPPYPHCLTFFPVLPAVSYNSPNGSLELKKQKGEKNGERRPSKEKKAAHQYHSKLAGYCLSFKEEEERDRWLNSVLVLRQEYLSIPLLDI